MMKEAYHGFFDTFCAQATAQSDVTPLRNLLLIAAHDLKLTRHDINFISAAEAATLCGWMKEKQQERCELCSNPKDPIMWGDVEDIPFIFLYFLNDRTKTFCYDIISLGLAVMSNPVNPLTNLPLSPETVQHISDRFSRIASMMATLRGINKN